MRKLVRNEIKTKVDNPTILLNEDFPNAASEKGSTLMLRKDLNSQRRLTTVGSTVCLVGNISVQFSCQSAVVSSAFVQFVL